VQRCKKIEINGIDSATAKQMRQLIRKHLILITFFKNPCGYLPNRGKSVAFAFVTAGNKKPAGKTAGFKF
jgi:hypothetical protein